MAYTQDDRLIAVDTPLGKDALLLQRLSGVEGISTLFRFDLDLLAEDDGIAANALIGQRVIIRLRLQDGATRYINGFVNEFGLAETDARLTRYRMAVVPWLWFLTRTSDCRIFQNKNVPQIIEQIFNDLKLHRLQAAARRAAIAAARLLRAVPRDRLQLCLPPDGAVRASTTSSSTATQKHTLVLANSPDGACSLPAASQGALRGDRRRCTRKTSSPNGRRRSSCVPASTR